MTLRRILAPTARPESPTAQTTRGGDPSSSIEEKWAMNSVQTLIR
jgi:hypothetical protein